MSTTPLTFRAATLADVPAVVALVESAYRGESGRRGWTTESDLFDGARTHRREVTELVTKPDRQIVLAHLDDRLVGCAYVKKKGDVGHFGMFAVDPAHQTAGIGKLVIAEAERLARETYGCSHMEMTVISVRTELLAWYERRGYRPTGHLRPFPSGNGCVDFAKKFDLYFRVMVKPL